MNKKLLTLAIGAALASAPMFANAAATVYGAAHMSIDSLDNGNATDSTLITLSSNSSFIGFKAEEDVGGGMKAIAGVEWQIGTDNAVANLLTNRNTFVGLTGGFGTVRVGNYDDVLKQVGAKVDFFMNEQLGERRSLTAANSMDARTANSINYESPKLGPVTITANYGFANSSSESTGSDLTTLVVGAQAETGGLYVGAAYKSRDIDVGTTTDATTAYRVSAAYTFGFGLKLGGLYQNFQDDSPAGTANDVDLSVYGVGASYKIGNGSIKAQYYVAGESTSVATNGATLMAIGYDHSLSKTTTVYVTYASVENDGTAANGGTYQVVSGAGHNNPAEAGFAATTAGNDASGISLGMKMAF